METASSSAAFSFPVSKRARVGWTFAVFWEEPNGFKAEDETKEDVKQIGIDIRTTQLGQAFDSVRWLSDSLSPH